MLAFLAGIVGLYLLLLARKTKRENRANGYEHLKEVDLSKLDEDEQRICTLIQEQDGSMYKSDLIKETCFSKVHMTRVLDKLEGKKILERKRRGMTNIIVLR